MDLVKLVAEYGVKNLRFFIPMQKLQFGGLIPRIAFKVGGDPTFVTECYIDEELYKVEDNYKITLRAMDLIFGRESYYISDLESLLKCEPDYRVFVLTIDGYTEIKHGGS
jgi:hypothetical protein